MSQRDNDAFPLAEEIKDSLTTAETIVEKLLARNEEDKVMLNELKKHIGLFKTVGAHAFVRDNEDMRRLRTMVFRLRTMVLNLAPMFERDRPFRVDAKTPHSE